MYKGQNEIRMIWLMVLIITGVGAWFLEIYVFTYLCSIALVMSLIQYVDALQQPIDKLAHTQQVPFAQTSKVPLYISSIVAVVGGVLDLSWLIALSVTAWIFFFLRWLRRLENNLNLLHRRIEATSVQHKVADQSRAELSPLQQVSPQFLTEQPPTIQNISPDLALEHPVLVNHETSTKAESVAEPVVTSQIALPESTESAHTPANTQTTNQQELGMFDYVHQWIFKGNPVLKVAILVLMIGLILLLRFATEQWQISLAVKLSFVAGVSAATVFLGSRLILKNRSFALAVEGLGLSALYLTLFFAYYNGVISSLPVAGLCFVGIMALTLYLSLKQQSFELALMALLIAYIAPFTLPVRDATAVELIAYYVVINLAVAVLTTFRPWKLLNQIAFIVTVVLGGLYALGHYAVEARATLSVLVLLHLAIFVWIGFRFSQLTAKADLAQFKLKPVLDLALIFGAPVIAYLYLYLMYFHHTLWQAGFSGLFALIYAFLYAISKKNQTFSVISQSYLSLLLIFVALIPPILLPEHWSVMGWAVEGACIFSFALWKKSAISRSLAMGLLLMAGFSVTYYYGLNDIEIDLTLWVLGISYVLVVLIANSTEKFRQQLSTVNIVFFSMLMLIASIVFLYLFHHQFDTPTAKNQAGVYSLFLLNLGYLILNEVMLKRQALWTWLVPKWFGMIPNFIFALIILWDYSHLGVITWSHTGERIVFALACLMMTLLWLRPIIALRDEKEWVSLGTLLSLSFASICLFPSMLWISIVILPLILCVWGYLKKADSTWQILWQSYSTLFLMLIWIVCSQLFSQQAFNGYLLPILNPFDVVSLAILASFIWVLSLQLKQGLDRGIVAVLVVLSVLWLSSYVLLRALHMYFATPYNQMAIWHNATVQLSLTFLWVILALISMRIASLKQLRSIWILGSSILAIVTLKLVLFDLSNVGTLMRVISFLGAGGGMLLIAYIAPMPEAQDKIESSIK